jgi:hypothetical protein
MGWTVIEHKSAPASDMFDFTSLSLGSYQRVVLVLDDLTLGTDGAFVRLQLSTATTLRTSGYRHRCSSRSSSGSDDNTASASTSSVLLIGGATSSWGIGNAAGETGGGRCEISGVGSGNYKLMLFDGAAVVPSGSLVRYVGAGLLEQTGVIDGVRIIVSTGTLTAGKATLYGLTTS